MPDTAEVLALGLDALATLQALAAQQDALWTTSDGAIPDLDRDEHDQRHATEVQLTDQAMHIYAQATGRCADHFTIGITYALTESTRRCRNRAKAPGPLCGTHQATWDHRLQVALHRVESNRRLAEAQDVADQLRAHGVEVDGVGTAHLSIPLDTARELIAHLARVGDLA